LGLLGYVGEELLKNTLNLMGSQGEIACGNSRGFQVQIED